MKQTICISRSPDGVTTEIGATTAVVVVVGAPPEATTLLFAGLILEKALERPLLAPQLASVVSSRFDRD